MKIIVGDLLYTNVDMICQQNNCVTTNAKGLSKSISDVYKVYPYSKRIQRDIPGTCSVYVRWRQPRYIACLFGQYSPGIYKSLKYR